MATFEALPAPEVELRPLLATEHSEFDVGAERVALALAARSGAPLDVVLPMVGNPEFDAVAPAQAARDDAVAADKLQRLQALAAAQGVRLAVRVRRGAEPYREIVDEAATLPADVIVIRRRGRAGLLANLLLGEMVGKVIAQAPCHVLVNARAARLWQRAVLVAIDPSDNARGGVAPAARIAAGFGLPLGVVCVADGAGDSAAQQALDAALAEARALGAAADGELVAGAPHTQILDAARRRGADLIVLARHGSVAHKVIGLAECPLLLCVSPPPPR
jgi:nucleotide-binding universal stress UspA family protein